MNAEYIPSFTERALFNQTALDWLCPPNCEKRKIEVTSQSVLDTLLNSKINPYSGHLKEGYWHWGTKPIKAAGRVVYTALVTTAIAPLGVLWHGGYETPKHLLLYTIRIYQQNEMEKQHEWNKTKKYAEAFFTDLTAFIVGATLSFTGGITAIFLGPCLLTAASTSEAIALLFVATFMIGWVSHMLGGFEPASKIPLLIAYDEHKTGMYFALAMRNELGLVNKEGGLLSFSSDDKIEYEMAGYSFQGRSYLFKGKVVERLAQFICQAELELIDLVREANQWIAEQTSVNSRKKITYSYPFDGKAIAKQVEEIFHQKQKPAAISSSELTLFNKDSRETVISDLLKRLKLISYKIEVLKGFDSSAKKLALEDSLFIELIKAMGRQSTSITINSPPSYVKERFYRGYFERPYISMNSGNFSLGSQGFYNGLCVKELDPKRHSRPNTTDLYELFKYETAVAKWYAIHEQKNIPPHYKLIGLEEGYTYRDFKRAFLDYAPALHPDKLPPHKKEEGTELFKIFREITSDIKQELDK